MAVAGGSGRGRLEALLFRKTAPREHYAQPDYAHVHQELKRKGVTLQLLWEEYEKAHGRAAYRYSQYCEHYHEYRGSLARSMRQVHRAGEKVFIDYSGDTVAVIDCASGEILAAEIFVGDDGRVEIRLRGGDLDADAAGLDRLEYPDAGVLRGGPESVDSG